MVLMAGCMIFFASVFTMMFFAVLGFIIPDKKPDGDAIEQRED